MRLFVVGDSISIEYGPFLEQYLKGSMQYARKAGEQEARLNLDRPQGANGGDSAMVLAFLQQLAETGGLPADLLAVNCGLHDIKTDPHSGTKQVPIADYRANLTAIIAIAERLAVRLLWIRSTPCDEAVHNRAGSSFLRFAADLVHYNQVADSVMAAAGVPLIDLFGFTANLGPDLYRDHVHFHEPIQRLQAAFIAGSLRAFGSG